MSVTQFTVSFHISHAAIEIYQIFEYVENKRIDVDSIFSIQQKTQNKEVEQAFRTLKNTLNKQILIWWDILTLEKYVKDEITPRRLPRDVAPNDGMTYPTLQEEWYKFFKNSEKRMLNLILDRRRAKLTQLNHAIQVTKGILDPHKDTKEYIERMNHIKEFMDKVDKETQNKKLKKYQRDINDYQQNMVYKWQAKREGESKKTMASSMEGEEGCLHPIQYSPETTQE